ncbi:heterokaryon incompatibility protein-domain-containing protein [Apiospora marii]|uniref:Heterokaryon incompatibility protein-domain-containing protein n=1 Tax=Apiospora marii TaxID=335849 RepID=A0ABR1R0C1_9PEZI
MAPFRGNIYQSRPYTDRVGPLHRTFWYLNRIWAQLSGQDDELLNSEDYVLIPDSGHQTYLAGTSLPNLQSLSWNQAPSGKQGRKRDIPTWSWASMATVAVNVRGHESWSGMAAQWPFNSSTGAVTNGICEMKDMLPVPVTNKSRLNFGRELRFRPENQYGDDTRFAILSLRERALPASVRRKLPRKGDALVAARLSYHHTHRDRYNRRGLQS